MLKINIDKSYDLPTTWGDIPLSLAAQVQQMTEELPSAIKDYYVNINDSGESDLADKYISEKDTYERSLISLLCGVPASVLESTDGEQVQSLCLLVLYPFIITFLGRPVYEPSGITSFDWHGVNYLFPQHENDVFGKMMPLYGLEALPFCEASDISAGYDMRYAPLLVAILASPKDETYDQAKIKERVKKFSHLSSDIYWELFYLLSEAHKYMEEEFPDCYPKASGKKGKSRKDLSTWGDRLLYVAGDRPSELPYTEKMPCYEFQRLLQGKLKREKEQWNAMLPMK